MKKLAPTIAVLAVAAITLMACQPGNTAPTTQVPQTQPTPTATTATTKPTATTSAPAVDRPQYGGTIPLGWASDNTTLDPYYTSAASGPFSYVFETLGIADWSIDREVFDYRSAYWPMDVIIGNIAESWEEPDPTTLIYHIRKGIRWQNKPPVNGRELDAYDVETSFNRVMGFGEFTKKSPGASGFTNLPIESITATDKYTVTIKLKKIDFNVLEVTSFNSYEGGWILPREAIKAFGDFSNWKNWIGSGPWIAADHVDGSSWTFKKNPDYWNTDNRYPDNKLPYAEELKGLVIPDFATRLSALRTGKIVVMGGLSVQQSESLKKTNPELVMYSILGGSDEQAMNVTKPPFNDHRVRQAMQLALDNETIARTYYKGFADTTPFGIVGPAAVGFYVPFKDWSQDLKDSYGYNPTKAKQLLTEAGYPNGFKTTYELSTGWYAMDADFAQVLKSYWSAIGVDVEIKVMERGPFLDRLYARTYDGMSWGHRGTNYNPLAYITYMGYTGQLWNLHGASDPEYDALVDSAKAATNREDMMDYVRQADMYYIAQHWQTWTPRYGTFAFQQPWFKGYTAEFTMGGMNSGAMWARTWIDQPLRLKLTGQK